jgi:transposase
MAAAQGKSEDRVHGWWWRRRCGHQRRRREGSVRGKWRTTSKALLTLYYGSLEALLRLG